MTVTTTDLALQFPSVPYLKNSLSVGNTWTRYEFSDTTTAKPIIQTIATVVDQMSGHCAPRALTMLTGCTCRLTIMILITTLTKAMSIGFPMSVSC